MQDGTATAQTLGPQSALIHKKKIGHKTKISIQNKNHIEEQSQSIKQLVRILLH